MDELDAWLTPQLLQGDERIDAGIAQIDDRIARSTAESATGPGRVESGPWPGPSYASPSRR